MAGKIYSAPWIETLKLNDYIFKLMGYDSRELSPLLGEQRLNFIKRMTHPTLLMKHTLFKFQSLLRPKSLRKPPGPPKFKALLKTGTGGLAQTLVKCCPTAGTDIHFNTHITRIQKQNNTFTITLINNKQLHANHIISTIPAEELHRLMTTHTPFNNKLTYRDICLLFFKFPFKMPENVIRVIYSFDRNTLWKRAVIRRITPQFSVLNVEITLPGNSRIQPDQFIEPILADFTGPELPFDQTTPNQWDSAIVRRAYPCLLKNTEKIYRHLLEDIDMPKHLSIGRQGGYQYYTTQQCISSAEKTVAKLVAN